MLTLKQFTYAAFLDPELHTVLELASDVELLDVYKILYGKRYITKSCFGKICQVFPSLPTFTFLCRDRLCRDFCLIWLLPLTVMSSLFTNCLQVVDFSSEFTESSQFYFASYLQFTAC